MANPNEPGFDVQPQGDTRRTRPMAAARPRLGNTA